MKSVLITGATNGLGEVLVALFEAAGWLVIATGRDKAKLIPRPNVHVVGGDIRSRATQDGLVYLAEWHGLDVFINCAGVRVAKPFEEMTVGEIYEILEINLLAPMELTKRLWHVLQEQRSGVIVNVGSIASETPGPGETVYAAAKAGMTAFSKALQFDATKIGVQVVNLNLGAMNTNMTQGRMDQEKLMRPEDVADVIFDLCEQPASLRVTDITMNRRNY